MKRDDDQEGTDVFFSALHRCTKRPQGRPERYSDLCQLIVDPGHFSLVYRTSEDDRLTRNDLADSVQVPFLGTHGKQEPLLRTAS